MVYRHGGFVVTLWTHYETAPEVAPSDYGRALERLHEGMRKVHVTVPHFTDRVASAESLLSDPFATPNLPVQDRELLVGTLGTLRDTVVDRGADEQLLHGEPHPGNVLSTKNGLLFVDLETCCRGPVEFDIAHAPDEVGEVYRGADPDLLRDCRVLALAVATTWRWDRNDQLPNGRQLGVEWLNQIRAAVEG
jgi:thiamine kinase-like enzyme